MSSGSFQFPAVEHDLTVKVESDPFQKLPVEIIHLILDVVIDVDSVPNLCQASWLVHCLLSCYKCQF
jgi:hypothetical protein